MSQQVPEPPGTWHAKVFLAYAKEDRKVAVAVQEAVTEAAKAEDGGKISVVKWVVNADLTASIFDNIQSTMSGTHFGIFLYSPVDVKARDNVVFESGLFIGMKKADLRRKLVSGLMR
jgi:predicted nucleotide-binding protein